MAFSSKTAAFGARQWAVVVLLIVSWALAVWARILWNGDVYGLDYRLFHPDGICYGAMAFDFAGQGVDGRAEVAAAYVNQGTPLGALGPDMDDPAACSSGVRPRVLYPLLSVPFVNLLGYFGLLVVPALSWLAAVLIPVILLLRRGRTLAPAIAGLLVIASTSVGRWSVANLVDALLMGIMALSLLVLPIFERKTQWWRLGLFAFLVLLGSLTRQSWPTWIAVAAAPWVAYAFMHRTSGVRAAWGDGNPWAWFAALGTGIAVASWRIIDATLGNQNSAFALNRIKDALPDAAVPDAAVPDAAAPDAPVANSGAWFEFFEVVWQTMQFSATALEVEIGQLIVLDKALLIAIGVALFGVWKHRLWSASYAFLGVLFVVMSLSALNTTPGINFRFALAVVPWIVLLGGSWSQPAEEHLSATEDKPNPPSGLREYPESGYGRASD